MLGLLLDKQAPLKQNNICGNNVAASLNKELNKIIMTPLQNKTRYLK